MARARQTALVFAALIVIPAISVRAQVSLEVQLHGAPLVGSLHSQLSTAGGYRFESLSSSIFANDAETGERIYTITHPDRGYLTLSGILMRLRSPSFNLRNRIQREVERFNNAAAVGTMYFDEAKGEVTIEHHLNPNRCSIPAMAAVAERFGQVVRTERERLSRIELM